MPVYSSHLLRYEDLTLGQRIRDARVQCGLTLRELSPRVNISAARLSEIENERFVPDVAQVVTLAEALDVPVRSFLPPNVRIPYQIVHERVVRSQPPRQLHLASAARDYRVYHHEFWPLADMFIGRHLEPVLGRISPVAEGNRQFCYHHEEEFLFVLKGGVEFCCRTPEGLRREEIRRGDCIYFRSDLPHSLASLDSEPAETLHVLASASMPVETGFDRLSQGPAALFEHDSEASVAVQMGRRLRTLRDTHGWTTEQLAHVLELSERQLHRIERGERAAPLDLMLRLARAFGRPLDELIGGRTDVEPLYFIQRSSDIGRVPSRPRRTPVERPDVPASKTCQPLAGGFPVQHMYPYLIRLLNVDIETLTLHEHHGHEFLYVLDGELELRTYAGEQPVTEILRPGDSCYLDSSVPHLVRGVTRSPYAQLSAEVIDVFWSPLGEGYLFE